MALTCGAAARTAPAYQAMIVTLFRDRLGTPALTHTAVRVFIFFSPSSCSCRGLLVVRNSFKVFRTMQTSPPTATSPPMPASGTLTRRGCLKKPSPVASTRRLATRRAMTPFSTGSSRSSSPQTMEQTR